SRHEQRQRGPFRGIGAAARRGSGSVSRTRTSLWRASASTLPANRIALPANRRPRGSRAPRRAGAAPLDILYEDRVLLVINKPAGLLSVPLPNTHAQHALH